MRDPKAALALFALVTSACGSSDPAGGGTGPLPDARPPSDGAVLPDTPDAGTETPAHVLYPSDRRHSPITREIVDRLAAIASAAPRDELVFAKVGDSLSHAPEFLRCFDGGVVDLADRVALRPTIEHYLAGDAGGRSPFRRESLAAFNGATGELMLEGTPSRLDAELTAIGPRLGVVLLGTNDVRRGRTLEAFAHDLWTIADTMRDSGTIPLLSSIPANQGDPWADSQIPRWNLAIRGVAQGLQVPYVDLHRALSPLPNRGIGPDGIHLSVDPGGACLWTAAALRFGYNMRNLATLEMLHRVRAALAGAPSDETAAVLEGTGRAGDPYRVPYPFAGIGDTRAGEAVRAEHGCSSGRAQPGKELVYELELPTQVRLHAQVITRGATDVDVHVIQDGTCRAVDDRSAIVVVGPGVVQLVVDTPADGAEGEFLLVAGPRANPPS